MRARVLRTRSGLHATDRVFEDPVSVGEAHDSEIVVTVLALPLAAAGLRVDAEGCVRLNDVAHVAATERLGRNHGAVRVRDDNVALDDAHGELSAMHGVVMPSAEQSEIDQLGLAADDDR